ncbi:hypothetical protein [Rhodoplanes sp. SY1]|uniref:hypothetical protein n=1 Tax=Rhodoplanes sp. SY1 TaxID=3166646 RepID=UPI0038B47FE2
MMPDPDHIRREAWAVVGRAFRQLADKMQAERAALDAAPPVDRLFALHTPPPEHAVTVEINIGGDVSRTFMIAAPSTEDGLFWVAVAHRDPHGAALAGNETPVSWSAVAAEAERLAECDLEWPRAEWAVTAHPPMRTNVWTRGLVDAHHVGAEEVIRRGL